MRPLLICTLFLVLFTSCNKSPETYFHKDTVSFTCPSGWEITDEDNLDDKGYNLSIEKGGFDSSGMVSITWINSIIDLNLWLQLFIDEFENHLLIESSDFSFGNPTKDTYNSIETLSISYKGAILGVEHIGVIHAFQTQDKTFVVLKQEATEDIEKNKAGFKTIEQSFSIGN